MKTVLTIAGFDPSGGAGVLADIKTFAAFGCFGAAGITSITSQNTHGVLATFHHSADRLRSQLVPVLEDYQIAAVKIGMLPTRELVENVAELVDEYSLRNIVLDPLMQSSSGHPLIDIVTINYMCTKLIPRVDLLTPNLDEVAIFLGDRPQTLDEMKVAAQQIGTKLLRDKVISVLVKGGHLQNEATDVLFDGQTLHEFTTPKISSRHTHGTGCTLSSAIAALLAQDVALPEAVRRAKEFVTEAIRHAPGIGHGAGPLHHFFNYVANAPTR